MIDFYELLGISHDATSSEIKTAYRIMAKKYHPDVNKQKDASQTFICLNEAKETLLDPEKRKQYDLLLEEIKHSKPISRNKEETYRAKTEEYMENYSDTYLTKCQLLGTYLQYGLDSIWIKFVKCFFVMINFFFFSILKVFTILIVYLISLLGDFIDYFVVILIFLAIASLFLFTQDTTLDILPFIPSHVERFLLFTFGAIFIQFIKTLIITKSLNLYVLLQNLEDRFFIFTIMK